MSGPIREAERLQEALRDRVDLCSGLDGPPRRVVGLDVSYEIDSPRVAAAAVLFDMASFAVEESVVVLGEVAFPYVPGLLAFREVPFLLDALRGLSGRPDVLVCDGYGIAHPRRFGLACHIGVVTGLPTFGVAKTAFTTSFAVPEVQRGSWSPLVEGTQILGRAVRTRDGVKPVFVSVGHRISLDQATDLTLALTPRFRIPEVVRRADQDSRQALRRGRDAGAAPG